MATTGKLFNTAVTAEEMTESDLHALEGILKLTFSLEQLQKGVDLVRFLAETNILPSKGEARKMVLNGGISINRNKTEDIQFNVHAGLLLHEKYILIQKGKKNFYLVEAK